jgi:hypothetical protein
MTISDLFKGVAGIIAFATAYWMFVRAVVSGVEIGIRESGIKDRVLSLEVTLEQIERNTQLD